MTPENTDLIVPIEMTPEKALALFTGEGEFESLFTKIKEQTDAFVPDLTTDKGRKECASMARKVASTKVALEKMGVGVKEEAQKTVDSVNAVRADIKKRLDALRDEVRKPLTEWEEAKAKRQEEIDFTLNRLVDLARVPFNASADDIARMFDEVDKIAEEFDFGDDVDIATEKIEAAQKVLRVAKEAAKERERMEAENQRLREEQEARDAEAAEKQAEWDRVAAQELAQRQKAAQEAKDKADAQQAEIDRLQREKEEAEERTANAEREAELAKELTQREAEEAERQKIEAAEQAEREAKARAEAAKEEAERIIKEQEEAEELAAKFAGQRKKRLEETFLDLTCKLNVDDQNAYEILNAIEAGRIRHVTFE